MEQSDLGSSQFSRYCVGCLSAKDERTVFCVDLRNSTLGTIFQVECMFLCYLCKRALQQAELFIYNVRNNQILLENLHNIDSSMLYAARSQCRPPHQLSRMYLDTIELDPAETVREDSCVYGQRGVRVKQEMKEEGAEECGDDNDSQEPDSVVKEGDFPLNELFKKEVEVEVIHLTGLKKCLKKGTYKKRKGKIKKQSEMRRKVIETLQITPEQCLEERSRMSCDPRYLSSNYKCQDCIKGFNFKDSFDKHMEKHLESNGVFECDICKQRMSTEEKLISHKKYHEVRYRCTVCGLTRVSRLTVKDHYSAFHTANQDRHTCPHCPKSFKRRVSCRKHITNVHSSQRVTCMYCGKSYANRDVLKAHMTLLHPAEVSAPEVSKSHVCQVCGKAFKAPSQLKIHSTKHSHNRDFYCVECDKSFKSASILKHHLKTASTHVSYVELPLPCEHCDKRFAIRRDLERHTNRVHLNIKPFQCDRCEKAYVSEWSLNEHRRLVHEGFKRPLKYPCPMCDKVFDRNQVLKGHIRTHTGERPYQCSHCPSQFTQASILRTHVKLIHLKLTRDGRPKVNIK